MVLVGWILTVVIGAIAGWIAEQVMGARHGFITNVLLGIAGSVVMNIILALIFGAVPGGAITQVIVGGLGACLLIYAYRMIMGRRTTV